MATGGGGIEVSKLAPAGDERLSQQELAARLCTLGLSAAEAERHSGSFFRFMGTDNVSVRQFRDEYVRMALFQALQTLEAGRVDVTQAELVAALSKHLAPGDARDEVDCIRTALGFAGPDDVTSTDTLKTWYRAYERDVRIAQLKTKSAATAVAGASSNADAAARLQANDTMKVFASSNTRASPETMFSAPPMSPTAPREDASAETGDDAEAEADGAGRRRSVTLERLKLQSADETENQQFTRGIRANDTMKQFKPKPSVTASLFAAPGFDAPLEEEDEGEEDDAI